LARVAQEKGFTFIAEFALEIVIDAVIERLSDFSRTQLRSALTVASLTQTASISLPLFTGIAKPPKPSISVSSHLILFHLTFWSIPILFLAFLPSIQMTLTQFGFHFVVTQRSSLIPIILTFLPSIARPIGTNWTKAHLFKGENCMTSDSNRLLARFLLDDASYR
jgi:hypothetical protein